MNNIIILISLSLILVSFLIFFILRRKRKKTLQRSLDMSLFLVKLPRYEKEEKGNEKEIISNMEQFYSNFLDLCGRESFFKKFFYGSPRAVLEIASEIGEGDISFYIAVPSQYNESLNKYIQSVYSGAVIEKISSDYTIFEPNGVISAAYLVQKNTHFIPFNTYKDLGRDPLESIVNSVSGINSDEGAAIQIVFKPLPSDIKKKGDMIVSDIIEKGKSLQQAINDSENGILKSIIKEMFFSKNSSNKETVDEIIIEKIKEKTARPVFDVNIRIIGVGKTKQRSKEILNDLEGGFHQFTSGINGLVVKEIKKKNKIRKAVYDFTFRNFKDKQSVLLNSTELTSVYHFPLSHIESPHIKWVKSKEAALPSELPKDDSIMTIGETLYRGEKKKINIASRDDRRRHFYVIGQTGVGKSRFMREMIRQDIEKGEGVAVIDPHGELVEDTLKNIPKERIDDVVLFEPFDRERPCGLNMLEWETPEQRDFAISEMIMIFQSLFPAEMIGPMFEYYMRNAMAALMADKENQGTITDIPRMFTDIKFMEKRLEKVSDPMIRNFWLKEWKQTTGQTRSDMLGYVVSKIGRFVTDEMMRNIIGQPKSGFSLEKIMNEKKIFLANLSKGLTGEMNSSLLGLILVSKMQIAALRRARMPEEERNDFYLYVDEFQNFTTDSVATILSEARKYRLNLIIAHQYMPQLKEEIRNAVIGNVGTMVSFRVGIDDAEFLEKQFEPEFSRFDLGNIDNRQFVIRMMINNQITSPFKGSTLNSVEGDTQIAEKAKEISRLKYGKPRNLVEDEIIGKSQSGI